MMIRKVFLNGQVSTLLVIEDGDNNEGINPILEALKEQAERIETLEEQNQELIKQEEILTNLVEMTTRTSDLMLRSLQSLLRLEAGMPEKID